MRVHRQLLARLGSVLFLAGAFVVMNAARADATLIVYLCNDAACTGGGDSIITDGLAGDSDADPDSIVYNAPGGGRIAADTDPTQLGMTYRLTAETFDMFGGTPYIYATQDSFASSGLAEFAANATLGNGNASLHTGAGLFTPPFGIGVINCAMPCADSTPVVAPYYLAVGVAPIAAPPLPNGTPRGARGDATVTVTPQQTVPDGGSTATLLGSILLGFGMLRRKFRS
jgi:VPDSG-CTERM motif